VRLIGECITGFLSVNVGIRAAHARRSFPPEKRDENGNEHEKTLKEPGHVTIR
jgi:hypothetical protein